MKLYLTSAIQVKVTVAELPARSCCPCPTSPPKRCGHPCANKDARQAEPPTRFKHEGRPMDTIASHLAVATQIAARHLSYAHPLAAAQIVGQSAGTGRMTLALVILIIAMLAAMKSGVSAVRGLFSLLSELLRALAAMIAILSILTIAIVAVVILLVHP